MSSSAVFLEKRFILFLKLMNVLLFLEANPSVLIFNSRFPHDKRSKLVFKKVN
jgi:hypothetical protein